jgi:hypothetical protein
MNERLVPKMINFCVVKLSNSPAITCVPRLELDHFDSQPDSPRINQRFPSVYQDFSSFIENVGIRVLSIGPGDREFKREELHVKQTTGIVCA